MHLSLDCCIVKSQMTKHMTFPSLTDHQNQPGRSSCEALWQTPKWRMSVGQNLFFLLNYFFYIFFVAARLIKLGILIENIESHLRYKFWSCDWSHFWGLGTLCPPFTHEHRNSRAIIPAKSILAGNAVMSLGNCSPYLRKCTFDDSWLWWYMIMNG